MNKLQWFLQAGVKYHDTRHQTYYAIIDISGTIVIPASITDRELAQQIIDEHNIKYSDKENMK